MAPHPALVRKTQQRRAAIRAAVRAALDGNRLTPDQLKLALAEHDALVARDNVLTDESNQISTRTQGATDDRVYLRAARRLDEINRQCDDLTARARALRAHPQVRAAILAREAKEARS